MEWRLLTDIPFALDEAEFLAGMRVKPGSAQAAACQELAEQARALARPRAVYLPKRIDSLDETGFTAGGLRLSGSLFKTRLRAGQEIYLFLATCGTEISAWSGDFSGDLLRRYWADQLAERALRTAIRALEEDLRPLIDGEYLAAMHPGSLAEWPLNEQQPLFALLGGAAAACGVSLDRQCLMRPQKSVSGFYFGSASAYHDCELCPRPRCPNRRATINS